MTANQPPKPLRSRGPEIQYRDRLSGRIVTEKVLSEGALRWLYERPLGRVLFSLFLNNSVVSNVYGQWQNSPFSRPRIARFIQFFQLNLSEVELPVEQYRNFNAFFSRKLKPGARPFATDPNAACSPADGKILVYPTFDRRTWIPVKGNAVTIRSLLGSEDLAARFEGGSAVVIRLAPYDYHRFHFPDDGEAPGARLIRGEYHSVNPIALETVSDIFVRNKRAVTHFASAHFGLIAYVEVGAFAVSSIVQTYRPGAVARGQEKGFFQFGGSTLVLLYQPDAVVFDADLLRDSAAGLEVHVQTGSAIGRRGD